MKYRIIFLTFIFCFLQPFLHAQDTLRYTGNTRSNIDYHHGQLAPAIGVHNVQTMRALRSAKGPRSWTYNHAPMLAYWKGRFWLEYLSNPVGEHIPPGQTFLQSSADGYNWSDPIVIFPPYRIPDGYAKTGRKDSAKNSFAVMHQRVGFHTSAAGRFFALGYYGIVLGLKDDPNDGNGIGRVIREIRQDGTFGPIHFLRYNHGFSERNTDHPFFRSSKDKGLIAACEEFLSNPLQMMQTVEEADRNDSLIPLQKDFKAFSYFHLPDGRVAGLWKYALTSISNDGGRNWLYSPLRAPGFVNANAKIWGQRTSDGRYAIIYNPSEFRWPLAVSVSANGIEYPNLLLVNGEISAMRYGGAYKSYGPQYVRGIQETDGHSPDGDMWVTYSMNKEDIWVGRIPVPVREKALAHVDDVFSDMPAGKELEEWNTYSPVWCRVGIQTINGSRSLSLADSDPFDHARAERVFPASRILRLDVSLTAMQSDHGTLEMELLDEKGSPTLRLTLDSSGSILLKQGYRNKVAGKYYPGEKIRIQIVLNTATRFYTLSINDGKPSNNICFQPVGSVQRLAFRTGVVRRFPHADTPTDQDYDLPGSEDRNREAVYRIHSVRTGADN